MSTIIEDIQFMKSILPEHYEVKESKKSGSIHCKSSIGLRKTPYNSFDSFKRPIIVDDAEDEEQWFYIVEAIKAKFGERLQEIDHNTCFCHVDFTIYLRFSVACA
jgi:hypothetical protein